MIRRRPPRGAFTLLLVLAVPAMAGCIGTKEQTLDISNRTSTTAWIEVRIVEVDGEAVFLRNVTLGANESHARESLDLPEGKFRVLATASSGFEAETTVNGNVQQGIVVYLTGTELVVAVAL